MDQHSNIINPAFHHPNGFPPSPEAPRVPSSDIEMVSINGSSYTSLCDILPSPAPVAFPRPPSHESAWCEIPIKNPLVKHAAIAYLQPMSSAPAEEEGKGILASIVDMCGGEKEGKCCLWWFGDMVSRVGIGRSNVNQEADDEDEVVDQLRIQCLDLDQ